MKAGIIISIFLLLPSAWAQQKYRVYINEFLASNVSINADIVDFDDYSDWIELYNDEESEVDIGSYFITDDLKDPTKYQFPPQLILPPKGFLLLWADGYNDIPGHTYRRDYFPYDYYTTKYFHLNFSLSRAGEEIALYRPDTTLIDSISFSLQKRDVSRGRKPDGSPNWYYFGDPTPDSGNITTGFSKLEFSGEPVLSVESGFYNSTQFVNISANASNYQIKYTLDGSRPTNNSDTYNQPIQISETKVLRVRVYEQDKLPGRIYTFNYFINEPTDLAVISLSAFPEALWDEKKGIYDNQYKSREIPVTIEYFEPDRSKGFKIDVGLRMSGQASLDYPQKSFTISTDERYGTDLINYQIFPDRKLNSFSELYFRNAGVPDNRLTMFRDGVLHKVLINKIDIDCQAYVPTAFFINGEYWGIYNIREKVGSGYLSSLNNINPDNIDLLEYNLNSTPEVMEGYREEFVALINYIQQHDLSLTENFEYVESKIDIDEYINYYITEIYYDNIFWLNQNVRMWKERKDEARWRWILFDTDNAFGAEGPGTSNYQTNTLQLVTSSTPNIVYPLWSTLTFRKLIENEKFKIKFIQKFSSYMNTIFNPDSIIPRINEYQSVLSSEMSRHIERWNFGGILNGLPPLSNIYEWENYVEKMRQFATNRPLYQRQHIIDNFNLSGTSSISLGVNNKDMGQIIVNDFEKVGSSRTGIYFKGIPLELKAVPKAGYRFVKWRDLENESENPVSIEVIADSLNITADFEPIAVSLIPQQISQNTTLLRSGSPYYAQGDIQVDSSITLTMEAGVEILMPESASIIINGKLIINGSENNPVKISPNEYSQRWGALCFVNATDSSLIKYLKIIGATKGIDYTRDRAAISGYNSNLSLEGITVENVEAPIFIQMGNISIKGCSLYTTTSGDLINVKSAQLALVENCDLRGNNEFDSDGIDFDHVNTGIIKGNKIYNVYGFNSDAIDLGEGVKNAFIENNIIFNINDKGVSIGGASRGIIKRNIIANCGMGVGIKDYYSYGYMENNTFYANRIGVASFEKNIGHGGGSGDIVNCIIANSKQSSLLVDELSYLKTSYSLSNTDVLKGNNNLFGDPVFLNDLRLASNSPAINKGDPASPHDTDGSAADLGAIPFDSGNQINLLISEIHYNPSEGEDYQFIELVNAGNSSINVKNIKIMGDISGQFEDSGISAGEYFIIAKDRNLYEGQGYKVFQWKDGSLGKNGSLSVYDEQGNIVDFVNYDNKYWWPVEPDGQGPSLELVSTSLENMVSGYWQNSAEDGGTPGKSNNRLIDNIYINEILAGNDSLYSDEYGEFDDWIEIYNGNNIPISLDGLYISDDAKNLLKFRIPADSNGHMTITPKGYILLWADGQPEQGTSHLSFRLDVKGEQIVLSQIVENSPILLDYLNYGQQSANVSYGRRPDGSDNWVYFQTPTPLESNGEEENDENLPTRYVLEQNYPNPFNSSTKIRYSVPQIANVKITVYDILGCLITTLVNEVKKPGNYELDFYNPALASAVYFYRIETPDYNETKKMLLLK